MSRRSSTWRDREQVVRASSRKTNHSESERRTRSVGSWGEKDENARIRYHGEHNGIRTQKDEGVANERAMPKTGIDFELQDGWPLGIGKRLGNSLSECNYIGTDLLEHFVSGSFYIRINDLG